MESGRYMANMEGWSTTDVAGFLEVPPIRLQQWFNRRLLPYTSVARGSKTYRRIFDRDVWHTAVVSTLYPLVGIGRAASLAEPIKAAIEAFVRTAGCHPKYLLLSEGRALGVASLVHAHSQIGEEFFHVITLDRLTSEHLRIAERMRLADLARRQRN